MRRKKVRRRRKTRRRTRKSRRRVRRNPGSRRRNPNIFRWAKKYKDTDRYLAVKVKEWRGHRGPTFTLVGSAPTLAKARKIAEKGTRAGLHVIVDTKNEKVWEAYIPRIYKFKSPKRSKKRKKVKRRRKTRRRARKSRRRVKRRRKTRRRTRKGRRKTRRRR